MTGAELALPWRSFEGMPAAWRLVVSRRGRNTTLSADESLNLAAAVEEGRVHEGTVDALLAARARRRRRWTFEDLAQGARGLSRAGAAGEMALGLVLSIAGLELVRSEVHCGGPRDGGDSE